MAKLVSEDLEIITFVELLGGGQKVNYEQETWQAVGINLKSGPHLLSNDKPEILAECLICRSPEDEIAKLLAMLQDLLAKRTDRVLFEPHEPFFELTIERSGQHGLKVETWMDGGNAQTGTYTWDAAGVRFHTTDGNLEQFVQKVKAEFAC
jgi:hypothetical protein